MSYEWENERNWSEGSGSFLTGLLTGVAVGIGLGMLFAPQAGSDLRHRLADSAGTLKSRANETYNQASAKVQDAVERGREAMNRGRETWGAARRESEASSAPIDEPFTGGTAAGV